MSFACVFTFLHGSGFLASSFCCFLASWLHGLGCAFVVFLVSWPCLLVVAGTQCVDLLFLFIFICWLMFLHWFLEFSVFFVTFSFGDPWLCSLYCTFGSETTHVALKGFTSLAPGHSRSNS